MNHRLSIFHHSELKFHLNRAQDYFDDLHTFLVIVKNFHKRKGFPMKNLIKVNYNLKIENQKN